MKKLYSLFLICLISALGLSAQEYEAKTITLKLADPANRNNCTVQDDNYNYISWQEDGTCQVTFERQWSSAHVKAAEGYRIIDNYSNKMPEWTIYEGNVSNGEELTVNLVEYVQPKWTFYGNAEQVYITSNYQDYHADEQAEPGKWVIDVPEYASVTVNPTGRGVLKTITVKTPDQTESTLINEYGYISIYSSNYPDGTEFTINSDAAKTAIAIFKVIGDLSVVNAQWSNYTQLNLTEESLSDDGQEVEFTNTSLPLIISHKSYNDELYTVTINGSTTGVEKQGTRFIISSIEDGDEVVINTQVPVVPVPFKIILDEGTPADVISSFQINYNNIASSEYLAEGYTVPLGKGVNIAFNTTDYNVSLKINDQPAEITYGYINITVSEETGYILNIKATARPNSQVTINCADWENLRVSKDYYGTELYELTGASTILSCPPSIRGLYFSALNDYIFTSATDQEGDNLSYSLSSPMSIEITDGLVINLTLEKVVRDQEIVVYLQPGKYWTNETKLTSQAGLNAPLQDGYNHVLIGDRDVVEFSAVSTETYSCSYWVNDEKLERDYNTYSYPGLAELKAGDVLKIFSTEYVEKHVIEYTIDQDVKANIRHDHVRNIETPASHQLLPGTIVHITNAQAQAIRPLASTDGTTFQVKVIPSEGEAKLLSPDADGNYSFTVDGPARVEVSNPNTGIDNIEGDHAASRAVYNLQGVLINADASSEDISTLPAGLYIIGGKKQIIK